MVMVRVVVVVVMVRKLLAVSSVGGGRVSGQQSKYIV